MLSQVRWAPQRRPQSIALSLHPALAGSGRLLKFSIPHSLVIFSIVFESERKPLAGRCGMTRIYGLEWNLPKKKKKLSTSVDLIYLFKITVPRDIDHLLNAPSFKESQEDTVLNDISDLVEKKTVAEHLVVRSVSI